MVHSRMEYFVAVKNDVCKASNDTGKCLWYPIKCKRQDLKSHAQYDLSHVKQLWRNYRKENLTHKNRYEWLSPGGRTLDDFSCFLSTFLSFFL